MTVRGRKPDGRLLALEGEVRRLLGGKGVVTSPDGTRWVLTVSDTGVVGASPAAGWPNLIPNSGPTGTVEYSAEALSTIGWSTDPVETDAYFWVSTPAVNGPGGGPVIGGTGWFSEMQANVYYVADFATNGADCRVSPAPTTVPDMITVSAGAAYALSAHVLLWCDFTIASAPATYRMGVAWYDAADSLISETLATAADFVNLADPWVGWAADSAHASAVASGTLTAPTGAAKAYPFVEFHLPAAAWGLMGSGKDFGWFLTGGWSFARA